MADFQLPEDLLDNVLDYFKTNRGNESCGAIVNLKGRLKFISFNNISTEPDTFVPEPIKYAAYNPFIYILAHSHSDNCIPSEHDIMQSNIHNVPYMIVNESNLEYSLYWPNSYYNLCGKEYKFGINDCFESCKKWYELHDIHLENRGEWQDDWWELGYDYLTDEFGNWPFIPTENLKYGNLIMFRIGADVPNHIGIYVGDDLFFHHAVSRLSCIEDLYPFWGEHIIGIYKYEKGDIRRLSRGKVW